MRTAINTCLTLLILMMFFLSYRAFAADCPVGYNMGDMGWDGSKYGDSPYMCMQTNRCKARPASVSLCFQSDTTCVSRFLTSGEQCTEQESQESGSLYFGGKVVTVPEPEPEPEPDPDSGLDPGAGPLGWALSPTLHLSDFTGYIHDDYKLDFQSMITPLTKIKSLIRSDNITLSNFIKHYSNDVIKSVDQVRRDLQNSDDVTINSINSNSEEVKELIDEKFSSFESKTESSFDSNFFDLNVNLASHKNELIRHTNTVFGELNHAVYNTSDNLLSTVMQGQSSLSNQMGSQIGSLNSQVAGNQLATEGLLTGLSDSMNSGFSEINSKLDNISSGFGDTSQIENSIDGLGVDLKGIKDALTTKFNERAFVGKVNFDVDGVLYKSSLYNDLFTEREKLELEYEELLDKVKNIFSLDTSQLNSGEYKDHFLDFLAPDGSGRQFSFKSGVFPAFIQQANLIATILLFIAAVIAVRVIMGGSK